MQGKKEKKDQVQEIDDEEIKEDSEEEEDHSQFNEKMQCRFYRKDFPEEGDLVIVSSAMLMPLDPNHKGPREWSLRDPAGVRAYGGTHPFH